MTFDVGHTSQTIPAAATAVEVAGSSAIRTPWPNR
jgi:hypothetical protein